MGDDGELSNRQGLLGELVGRDTTKNQELGNYKPEGLGGWGVGETR